MHQVEVLGYTTFSYAFLFFFFREKGGGRCPSRLVIYCADFYRLASRKCQNAGTQHRWRCQITTFSPILFSHLRLRFRCCTMGKINQKYRLKNWATQSSVFSFTRTAHSFACSTLLVSLARSAALTCLLACSLCSLPHTWESE